MRPYSARQLLRPGPNEAMNRLAGEAVGPSGEVSRIRFFGPEVLYPVEAQFF